MPSLSNWQKDSKLRNNLKVVGIKIKSKLWVKTLCTTSEIFKVAPNRVSQTHKELLRTLKACPTHADTKIEICLKKNCGVVCGAGSKTLRRFI